jgi:hypothetical protein
MFMCASLSARHAQYVVTLLVYLYSTNIKLQHDTRPGGSFGTAGQCAHASVHVSQARADGAVLSCHSVHDAKGAPSLRMNDIEAKPLAPRATTTAVQPVPLATVSQQQQPASCSLSVAF